MPGSAPNAFVRRFTQPGVVLVAVALTGAMGLVGGFRQIRSQILDPFAIQSPTSNGAAPAAAVDTDGDGLNDELELQAYGTSPYVADTDSDGVSDGNEVAAGTSPTCAAGTSCDPLTVTGGSSAAATTTPQAGSPTATAPADATPEQLRQLLVQAGLDSAQVNSLTDEELAAAWQAAVQQAGGAQ